MEKFLLESTDFTPIKLSIYERFSDNEITESEKDALLNKIYRRECAEAITEAVAMSTISIMANIAGIAACGVAAASAMVLLVAKVISMVKVKDKIKGSEELTKINNDIKKCADALKRNRSELQQIISEYRTEMHDATTRSNFYGSRVTASTSSVAINGQMTTMTSIQGNPQYDKEKSQKEALKAEKIQKIVDKYIKKRDEVKEQISELKKLKSRFLSVVRSNLTPEEMESVRTELDRIMKQIDM